MTKEANMNKILITIALIVGFTATVEARETIRGSITDHYKSVINQQPHNTQVCSDVFVPNRVGADGLISGAILGGIIGNNVTKNLPDGGTAGAIIGGLFGHMNQDAPGGTTQTQCSTRTTYTETQQNVYSHSTITFTDGNGRRHTVKFYK